VIEWLVMTVLFAAIWLFAMWILLQMMRP